MSNVENLHAAGFVLEPDSPREDTSKAEAVLLLALKGLSQRAIAAVKDVFVLLAVASVFWLFRSIHDPNSYQLAELSLYGVFVLISIYLVRRK